MTKTFAPTYIKNLVLGLIESNEIDFYNSTKIIKLINKHLLKWSYINKKIYDTYIVDDEQIRQTLEFVREEATRELLKYLILSNKISLNITNGGNLGYNITKKGVACLCKNTKKIASNI